jgi:hypothetical protein
MSRTRDRNPNQVTIANAVPHKKQRTPVIGVRNASALAVIAKKAKQCPCSCLALVLT